MKNVIREMKKSPAYSFIKEHIELEFQRLERDKITPWAFFLTKKGVKLTDFFGKEISYIEGSLEFEGSPREFFWKGFIQPFLNDIVSRNFSETESFCREKGLDWKPPLEETALLLKTGIIRAYNRMSDIDQRLRGKGYPDSVSRYNPQREEAISEAFVDERLTAAAALQPTKKKTLNRLYEEQKFWFWVIGIIIAIVGVLIKIFV
jgi:hypothetical protein